jgi:hypothetical protein
MSFDRRPMLVLAMGLAKFPLAVTAQTGLNSM